MDSDSFRRRLRLRPRVTRRPGRKFSGWMDVVVGSATSISRNFRFSGDDPTYGLTPQRGIDFRALLSNSSR